MSYQARSSLHTTPEPYKPGLFPEMQESQIRWARWRPHRLCGVEADGEGRFTIPTVYRVGKELRLNYRCALGGWIEVELLPYIPTMQAGDANSLEGLTFAECDRLTGDEEDQIVTWNGSSDISQVGGMAAIRIRMFQA